MSTAARTTVKRRLGSGCCYERDCVSATTLSQGRTNKSSETLLPEDSRSCNWYERPATCRKANKSSDNLLPNACAPGIQDDSPVTNKADGPWAMCVEEARDWDQSMVEQWNDGLDALLIFAGLFSAILTAFIIESRKELQPDLQLASVHYLQGIFEALQNISNSSNSVPALPPTSIPPSPAFVWINGLWYASLLFGMTGAMGAILGKAWVRGYTDSLAQSGNPRSDARRRQYFYTGTSKWCLSATLSAIPILLHIAFLLFFSGLIPFVFADHESIGYVMLGLISVSFILYAIITVLPLIFFESPFRTPVSSLLLRLVRWVSMKRTKTVITLEDTFSSDPDSECILADELDAKALAWLMTTSTKRKVVELAAKAISTLGGTPRQQAILLAEGVAPVLSRLFWGSIQELNGVVMPCGPETEGIVAAILHLVRSASASKPPNHRVAFQGLTDAIIGLGSSPPKNYPHYLPGVRDTALCAAAHLLCPGSSQDLDEAGRRAIEDVAKKISHRLEVSAKEIPPGRQVMLLEALAKINHGVSFKPARSGGTFQWMLRGFLAVMDLRPLASDDVIHSALTGLEYLFVDCHRSMQETFRIHHLIARLLYVSGPLDRSTLPTDVLRSLLRLCIDLVARKSFIVEGQGTPIADIIRSLLHLLAFSGRQDALWQPPVADSNTSDNHLSSLITDALCKLWRYGDPQNVGEATLRARAHRVLIQRLERLSPAHHSFILTFDLMDATSQSQAQSVSRVIRAWAEHLAPNSPHVLHVLRFYGHLADSYRYHNALLDANIMPSIVRLMQPSTDIAVLRQSLALATELTQTTRGALQLLECDGFNASLHLMEVSNDGSLVTKPLRAAILQLLQSENVIELVVAIVRDSRVLRRVAEVMPRLQAEEVRMWLRIARLLDLGSSDVIDSGIVAAGDSRLLRIFGEEPKGERTTVQGPS